jgi:hypothetical protein
MNVHPDDAFDRDHVCRLQAAGVEFGYRAFWVPSRETIPEGVRLEILPPDVWNAEFAPTFPIPAAGDPNFALLETARTSYYADPEYAAALKNGYEWLQIGDIMEDYP